MKACCVHLGLPKTATSSLQNLLFARHPDVAPLGKFLGNRWASRLAAEFVDELSPSRRNQEPLAGRRLRQEVIGPALASGKVPVLSKEGLSTGKRATQGYRAQRLHQIMSPCKVLIFLRNPHSLISSLYLQRLAAYNLRWETQSPKVQSGAGPPPCLPSLEEWIDQVTANRRIGPYDSLDYARLIQAYSGVFGTDNVGVFLFEELCARPGQVLTRLSAFLEIDPRETIRLMKGDRLNPSWRQTQLDLLREICDSQERSVLFRRAGEEERARMLGLDRPTLGSDPPATVALSARIEAEIDSKTAQGNRWLVEAWGLDLRAYHYPLG